MQNVRNEWYDETSRVAVSIVDVTGAAGELARSHLCGPVSAHYLAKALAAVALLAAETSREDEVVAVQMKCSGPLGGLNVECSAAGELRGYTEKKILDGFDGRAFTDREVVGESRIQVTRSVPGRIVSQGISNSFDGYLASSLQRRAAMYLDASVNDEVEVLSARGVLVEALPDSGATVSELVPEKLFAPDENILSSLGLGGAKLRRTSPLRFACRCSPARAAEVLAASAADGGEALPETVDVTCHMCGRTFTVKTR
jgi:molecular chaperone Hsp33